MGVEARTIETQKGPKAAPNKDARGGTRTLKARRPPDFESFPCPTTIEHYRAERASKQEDRATA